MSRQWLTGVAVMAFTVLCRAQGQSDARIAHTTVIPIRIITRVDASRAKIDDPVTAKTLQATQVDGHPIKRDSTVLGHIVFARGFVFDPTPYATQQPSVLAVHFDKVITKDATVAVTAWTRALADRSESQRATTVPYYDEYNPVVTLVQVGGDRYRPNEEHVRSIDGDIVAYHRNGGVFARLLPGDYRSRYSHFQCDGSASEVPVAVFSAGACGLYGFPNAYLTENGQDERQETFQLESRRQTVRIERGSTALLQIIP